MDPSGTFVQFEAKAIGSGSEGAQEVYHKVMSAKNFKDFNIRLAPKNDYSISRLIRPNKNEKIKEENKSGIYQIKCEE
ncbi:hypothetical protein L9F63_025131, partial [Diploptera punctata]